MRVAAEDILDDAPPRGALGRLSLGENVVSG